MVLDQVKKSIECIDGAYALRVCGDVERLQKALEELSRFCGVLSGESKGLLKDLLGCLVEIARQAAAGESCDRLVRQAHHLYSELRSLWLEQAIQSRQAPRIDSGEVLLDRLLDDGHLFLRQCESRSMAQLQPELVELMKADLRILQELARADLAGWMKGICDREMGWDGREPVAEGGIELPGGSAGSPWDTSADLELLKQRFRQAVDWADLVGELAGFVFKHGRGKFRGCPAFRLRPGAEAQKLELEPIREFATFPLDWLEGNRERIEIVERNTRNLLDGYRASNVLIWGPRGCGKSSLIRGLITKYYTRGLRGIEIPPEAYGHIPDLFEMVRGRREYFIGVLDNISMQRRESSIHTMARVLDGCLVYLPQNLVFYATSNYKDLIDREGERPGGLGRMQLDEVDAGAGPNLVNQGVQPEFYDPQQAERLDEQRAMDDRFALKVFMDLPRRKEYEQMVLSYAHRAGIEMDETELLAAFNIWRMRHNHDLVGGRTARDFIVDYYPDFAPCPAGNST